MEPIYNIQALTGYFKMKNSPHYPAAKQGDVAAAVKLINALPINWEPFKNLNAYVAPVQKTAGNAIPYALACKIAQVSRCSLAANVFLANSKPGSEMIRRMFYQPTYYGPVQPGNYILVDDVFTTGITLNGLQDYITRNNAQVTGIITLTCARYGTAFAPAPHLLATLLQKFPGITAYFNPAQLTTAQVTYLLRFSSLRNLFIKRDELNLT